MKRIRNLLIIVAAIAIVVAIAGFRFSRTTAATRSGCERHA